MSKARVTRSAKAYLDKDSNYYLNSAADNYIIYDKEMFNNLRSLAIVKTVEVVNDELLSIKSIDSVIFLLNINGRKISNTVVGVEYVSNLNYNLIITDLLESKECKITQSKGRIIIVDENDDLTFITIHVRNR